jgi:hypothetical protein
MKMKAGMRLRSSVCKTEIVVVRPPSQDVDLWCGGASMVTVDDPTPSLGTPIGGQDQGSWLGKRYVNESVGLEVLCTKAGDGTLSLAGEILEEKVPKPLPSSD